MTMRKQAFLIGLGVFLVSAAVVWARQTNPSQQPPPPGPAAGQGAIVRNVNLVDVLFTVTDKHGNLITDLQKKDFKVFDDGVQQEITSFSQPVDLPLRIGLVLDTSNSIQRRLKFEQDAAINFLYSTLRLNKDQAFLMTVDSGPQIIHAFTGDDNALRDSILQQRAGGGTALYDGIYEASNFLLNKAPLPKGPDPEVRRVLVVISDGDDNDSDHTQNAAVDMAQRAGEIIYTISSSAQWVDMTEDVKPTKGLDRKYAKTEGDHVLEDMAEQTGGRAFFPYYVDDLGQAFIDIKDELRHQYALAYTPAGRTADGKFHKIRVEVDQKHLKVRARKGYYAIPPAASPEASLKP